MYLIGLSMFCLRAAALTCCLNNPRFCFMPPFPKHVEFFELGFRLPPRTSVG